MKIAKLNGKPEIFYSIQGEGRNMGQPSVFIRSSLCNLHCIWCDTDYTWNWEGTPFKHNRDADTTYKKFKREEQILEMTPEEVVQEVSQYPCTNFVLTGGEPLLQQEEWIKIMELIRQKEPAAWFEIETNGTLLPNERFNNLINQYNVSPKLENSGNELQLRERPQIYQFYAQNPKALFKYVIVSENDLQEVLKLIQKYQIPTQRVFLMPEGVTPEQLKEKQRWLAEICKEQGFHFSDRLHVRIWGAKRGV